MLCFRSGSRKGNLCEMCGKSLGKKYTQAIQHMYLRHGVPFKVSFVFPEIMHDSVKIVLKISKDYLASLFASYALNFFEDKNFLPKQRERK